MGFRIHKGIWQFQKSDGTYESKYRINSEGTLVETDTDGNEAGNFVTTPDWSNITGKPTNLSSFTNDLGNYGGWLTTSGKAADANLLDGLDSSRFVYGDGSNGKSINKTDSNANTSDSSNASGFYFGTRVTGMPTTDWWNWVTVRGNSWSGSDGYHFQLAGSFWSDDFRIRRMQSGSNQPWVTLIHSGNIGSQSVSNADTVDGKHANNAAGGIPTLESNGYWYAPSWINVGTSGLFSGTNNAHFRPNTSSYGSWEIIGSKNGWSGIHFRDSGNNLMLNANDSGFYNVNAGWQIEWYNGTLSVSKQANGGGTLATVLDSSNYSSWAQPASTAINTGNIGSQSVNYAANAGAIDGIDSGLLWRRSSAENATAGAGWITVAVAGQGGRYSGEVLVTDGESSDHSFIRIHWMRSYQDSNFVVLNCGGHSNRITGARVLYQTSDTTYGWKYLQVYVTTSSDYYVRITQTGDTPNFSSISAVRPVVQNSISGYAVHGAELTGLDNASLAAEEGIVVGGNVYTYGETILPSSHSKSKIRVFGAGDEWIGTSSGTLELSGASINLNGGQGSGTANLKMGGTTVISSSRALQNVSGNISMFTNDSGYLTSLPSHTHDDRYYTESESDSRFVLNSSRGQIGNSTVSVGSTANWPMNPAGGTYTTSYSGHGGTVIMSADVGGSAGSIGLEFTYNGQFYYHSNTDSNRWTSHQVWTSANFANNSGNWNTAYGWGNHASAGYQAASTAITTSNIGSQSVSNADTVDSLHASSFLRSDSTNSLFRTTAGNGLGLRFWDSDNYKIWMSSTGDGTWGGRLDSSSDYNMYFKMSGGTNRGFAFKNSTTTVAQIDGGGTIYTASHGNSSQWDSAYRWGNHASAGYVASNGSTWTPHASTNRDASWNTFYTNYGYIQFGPANSSWAHIYSDKNFYFNQNLYVNGAKMATESYVTSRGYITSVPAQSWDSITGKPSTFSPSSHTHGIGSVTDASRWWNNFGDNHSTRTSFDAAGSALSTGFGWRYVQGSGNSPGWGNTGNNQYYALTVGLGNDYDYNLYGMQLAIPRQGVTPYLSIRFEENRVLGAWQKISAGYADSAGSVAWANVSGKPSTFSPSSHTHDDRYYTESEVNTLLAGKQAAGTYLTSLPSHDHSSISGTAQGLSIRGYGTDSFSFQQTSSTFAGWGGWANHFIGNHGNGATYYNTVHTMPFWSSPMYSRLEGGNQTEIFQYWTEENFDPGSKANLNGSLATDFYANKMFSDNWFRAKGACGLYFEDYGYGLWSAYSAGATYGNVSTYATGRNGWTGYSVNNWISMMAIDTRRGLFLTDQDRWLIKWDNSEAFSDYEIMMGSDGRNKSNVQTLTNSLDKVLSLRGVSYNYKNQEKTSIGFIAQEVKEVIPEVVSLDSEGYYAVGYQNLVAVLAEAIKEQQAQIDELKQIINNLTK